jgi:Zn-dependent protease
MLKFSLFRVPVTIDWWFWLVTALLGGGASAHGPEDWGRVLVWMLVVFVSILVHEFGHAFAGRRFGATPFIRLHGFGGVTFLPGASFTRPQHILVSAAGPAAGLALGLLVLALGRFTEVLPPQMVTYGLYVNFFWTFINLLPIQPLDGGQILGQVLGPRRERATAIIGFVLAAALGVWCATRGLIISALLLAMLAYYNIRRAPVEGGVITQKPFLL